MPIGKVTVAQSAQANLYHAKVYVTLRPSVLDPAGTAVRSGLAHMGYDNVSKVRIGKYIELDLTAESEAAAQQQLDKICDQLLANPVIENYRIEVLQAAAAV
ncbi:phosphoribosylformylglycinamidine synthase subunit PurS [Leptolyngbya sp. BC1307]|uniref:phosphoribosylformylglycinamidine synthase subunit PurS n=1 Tax=Leptolyngbya sp. BC1307 TaxID=2029589 RepID=UPI001F0A53D5|nr:phosphoribosylformylglycinamidine synthase subunit PurS [Leptolyngbya sp. BC1307]